MTKYQKGRHLQRRARHVYHLEQVQQTDIDEGRLVTTANANCSDSQKSTYIASNATTVTLPGTSKLTLGKADRRSFTLQPRDIVDYGHVAA